MNAFTPDLSRLHMLPLGSLAARPDARDLSADTVAGLAESIAEVGLLNPLRVRQVQADGDLPRYEIIAGRHRFEAAGRVGFDVVPCIISGDDDTRAELAMIDENLMRSELGTADRVVATARRKELYILLHPETAHGTAGAVASNKTQGKGDATATMATASFASATAKATGRAERSVRRDAEIGGKLVNGIAQLVRGTPFDTLAYLNKLKLLKPSEQRAQVARDIRLEKERKRKGSRPQVKTSDDKPSAVEPVERQPVSEPVTTAPVEACPAPTSSPMTEVHIDISACLFKLVERWVETNVRDAAIEIASRIGAEAFGRSLVDTMHGKPVEFIITRPPTTTGEAGEEGNAPFDSTSAS